MEKQVETLPPVKLSAEKALTVLATDYFEPAAVKNFLEEQEEAEETAESLVSFLRDEKFGKLFEAQWRHETGKEWGERSSQEVMRETITHALGKVVWAAKEMMPKVREEMFSGCSQEEIERARKQAELLLNYFRWRFSCS